MWEYLCFRVGAKFYQRNRFKRTDRKVSPGHRSKIRERSKSVFFTNTRIFHRVREKECDKMSSDTGNKSVRSGIRRKRNNGNFYKHWTPAWEKCYTELMGLYNNALGVISCENATDGVRSKDLPLLILRQTGHLPNLNMITHGWEDFVVLWHYSFFSIMTQWPITNVTEHTTLS